MVFAAVIIQLVLAVAWIFGQQEAIRRAQTRIRLLTGGEAAETTGWRRIAVLLSFAVFGLIEVGWRQVYCDAVFSADAGAGGRFRAVRSTLDAFLDYNARAHGLVSS